MLSKRQQQHITALHQKKYRQKYDNFIVEGDKMAAEAISNRIENIVMIAATDEWLQKHQSLLHQIRAEVMAVSEEEMRKITTLATPSRVLLVMRPWEIDWETPVANNLVLYCDGIADPGNLGTIIRIADWFGFGAVCCTPDCCEIHNPKTVQATMGAIYRVPTVVMPLANLSTILPQHPIFGAVFDGKDIFSIPPPSKGILVVGSESHGIRRETMALVQQKITILSHGGAESLNAAVATGIICAAFRRSVV